MGEFGERRSASNAEWRVPKKNPFIDEFREKRRDLERGKTVIPASQEQAVTATNAPLTDLQREIRNANARRGITPPLSEEEKNRRRREFERRLS